MKSFHSWNATCLLSLFQSSKGIGMLELDVMIMPSRKRATLAFQAAGRSRRNIKVKMAKARAARRSRRDEEVQDIEAPSGSFHHLQTSGQKALRELQRTGVDNYSRIEGEETCHGKACNGEIRYEQFEVPNPHIPTMSEDVLYHLALSNGSHDLKEMFGDVKFVCFGGSRNRMLKFAEFLVKELKFKMPSGQALCNIAGGSDRYVLYKVGPVLSVSHGMGIPSLSIVFNEILKLIYHAGCSDVMFFRVGTSGGLGLEPGSVVITEEAVDGLLQPFMEMHVLGKVTRHPAKLDEQVAKELLLVADSDLNEYETILGRTMSTSDFYEGQGRLDGAFCNYTEGDKMTFLKQAYDNGVRNIEMESLCFSAFSHRAGLRSAVVCVTLLDRLKGDQLTTPHAVMEQWQARPQKLLAKYIRKKLGIK